VNLCRALAFGAAGLVGGELVGVHHGGPSTGAALGASGGEPSKGSRVQDVEITENSANAAIIVKERCPATHRLTRAVLDSPLCRGRPLHLPPSRRPNILARAVVLSCCRAFVLTWRAVEQRDGGGERGRPVHGLGHPPLDDSIADLRADRAAAKGRLSPITDRYPTALPVGIDNSATAQWRAKFDHHP